MRPNWGAVGLAPLSPAGPGFLAPGPSPGLRLLPVLRAELLPVCTVLLKLLYAALIGRAGLLGLTVPPL